MRVFENMVWENYLGIRGTRYQGSGENYIMRSLMICNPHSILLVDQIGKNEMDVGCSTYGEEEKGMKGLGEGI
jgi:hypothetical protein